MTENSQSANAPESAEPSVVFSRDEMVLLWQLVNMQGAGVPFKNARIAGELYATIRDYAALRGVKVIDDPPK